ncbi:putative RING-H2 finger protein ATL49 [Phragmites australis]|uniref:putative RING-H2 finger protein ATL49 n=1 Tax=Phragmites australis TaxID=29695 RepID=UPI002D77D86E|nr:putative RING-H2 finger protein ATL49 [Phragmites australis]
MNASGAAPPPPPHGGSIASTIERKLSPGILLIAILAMVFFISGLLNLLVQYLLRLRRARRRRRRVGDAAGDGSPTPFQGQLGQLFHLHDAGVDQAFIDALPVFPYRAVAGRRKDPFDCAVCLCEFTMDDKLRLLPTCGHAFHVACIDAWLLSHSTCPLCRGSILAEADHKMASSPILLMLESESLPETVVGDGSDPGDRDNEESPKAEEIVEVKLGKLRCVDGNVNAGDLAVHCTSSSNGNDRGSLGQRRCLSMGSYEYVMDEHAALRVAVKTTPKRRPASSRSRRRLALSACDFGGSNKGAWETAVTEAAASADAGRCSDGAASLNKDSFSTSKIWMVSASKREDNGRRTAELAAERRALSFRWPSMAAGCKKHRGSEESWDVEVAGSCGDNGVPSVAEERPSFARAALQWDAGGRQGGHS